jgi:voltage-gated potassium channel
LALDSNDAREVTTGMGLSNLRTEDVTRRDVGVTMLVAFACSAVLIAIYYAAPVGNRGNAIWLRLTFAMAIFVAVLAHELRAILRDLRPVRRAVIALAILLPLFLVTFAYVYLTMSASDAHAFGHAMTHTESLYFTLTMLSTVGFGDIAPKSDPARIVAMVQMTADIIFVAVVVRLIFGAASREVSRRTTSPTP